MITLEQIRRLEKRVHTAVSLISALKGENTLLKQKLAGYERRITELEAKLVELKEGQSEIERGLLSALDQLDALEDEILDDPPEEQPTPTADREHEDHGEVVAAEAQQEPADDLPDSASNRNSDAAPHGSTDADAQTETGESESDPEPADELDIF